MSIDYYAVAERNEEAMMAVLEGDDDGALPPIAASALAERITSRFPAFERFVKDFAAIAKTMGITEEDARTNFGGAELNWTEDGYIQVEISNAFVHVSHGFDGGDLQLEVLEGLIALFKEAGLSVWDPQNETWLD